MYSFIYLYIYITTYFSTHRSMYMSIYILGVPKHDWVLTLAMGWVLLNTLTLLGSSSCNGMVAVENPNPIGF